MTDELFMRAVFDVVRAYKAVKDAEVLGDKKKIEKMQEKYIQSKYTLMVYMVKAYAEDIRR